MPAFGTIQNFDPKGIAEWFAGVVTSSPVTQEALNASAGTGLMLQAAHNGWHKMSIAKLVGLLNDQVQQINPYLMLTEANPSLAQPVADARPKLLVAIFDWSELILGGPLPQSLKLIYITYGNPVLVDPA